MWQIACHEMEIPDEVHGLSEVLWDQSAAARRENACMVGSILDKTPLIPRLVCAASHWLGVSFSGRCSEHKPKEELLKEHRHVQ